MAATPLAASSTRFTGHDSAHKGFNGYLTGIGSTNGNQAGGSGGIEYGREAGCCGQTAAVNDPAITTRRLVSVENSFSREGNAAAGFGYYPKKGFFSFNYNFDKRRYGIPFDPAETDPEIVELNPRRHSFEFRGGFRETGTFIDAGTFSVQYNNYTHAEIDSLTGEMGTAFKNNTFLYQGLFDQRKTGKLSGVLVSGECIVISQRRVRKLLLRQPNKMRLPCLALRLSTSSASRFNLVGGWKIIATRPELTPARGVLPDRSFTGFSGAVGIRVRTWNGGVFVANYSHSYRAPALEELYNFGPHPGNLAFEIGNPDLTRELGDGLDFGIRHSSKRVRFEANGFYYRIRDFIFLAPTGDIEDGLTVAEYDQATARHAGFEARFDTALHKNVWLNTRLDYVNAELTSTSTPLPRIPPLRGRVGLELRYKGLLLNPEMVMANRQDRLFPNETETAGYAVFNLSGSYLIARQHAAHIISFNFFNVGNTLYRNHLSFIKEFAPEMGRGLRVTYTLRFF